ncbi:MAG TPA: DeoR family transcriptional regulator, partial [Cedecea sp.]
TVVLASAAKLNAASQYAIGDITLAQSIIVERSTDATLITPLEQAGVTVIKA